MAPEQTVEKGEFRSYFVEAHEGQLPSNTSPCDAPEGYTWVHCYAPHKPSGNRLLVGKWLIFLPCQYVQYCWSRVRVATEAGTLGIAAKVSTDWGNKHDPGLSTNPQVHVVCVFTHDFLDKSDVVRVMKSLAEIDAIRKGTKQYKPDLATRLGLRELIVYTSAPPYDRLKFNSDVLDNLEALVTYYDYPLDLTGAASETVDLDDARRRIADAFLRIRG